MELISPGEWNMLNQALNDAADTFFNKPVLWRRAIRTLSRYGEDEAPQYNDIPLLGLFNYNFMRSWPITFTTDTGELDRQSVQVLFSKKKLAEAGYINSTGAFMYDPAMDRFVIDGTVRKAVGDTPVSQTNGEDLYIAIIFKAEELLTGT